MNVREKSDGVAANETPEQWWAKVPAGERRLAQELARMMKKVTATQSIEIRRDGEFIKARFIHILKKPEKGCVSALAFSGPPDGRLN